MLLLNSKDPTTYHSKIMSQVKYEQNEEEFHNERKRRLKWEEQLKKLKEEGQQSTTLDRK